MENINEKEVVTNGKSNFSKFLLTFFFLILAADTISYLVFQSDIIVALYQKILSFCVLTISAFIFFKWPRSDRKIFLLFLLILIKLVIESMINYGTPLVYPSVLAVIFPVAYVYFAKNLFDRLDVNVIPVLVSFIFLGYFLFMILHGHEFDFSNTPLILDETGPYSGDTRILHANSILLLVLPFLYFLNKLLTGQKSTAAVAGFATALIIILIHQHRTVWLTTMLSSGILLFLQGSMAKMLKNAVFFVLGLISFLIILIVVIPGFGQLLIERFSDVFDPLNEDNTSGFRYLQILSYLNYYIEKPLFGWGFAGFDLSNPFSDAWEEGTGHHFHNAYIEILFYFGIAGLLLKYYPLYSIARKMRRSVLTNNSKVLCAFCVSGFLYSFSYVPPPIFWGIVGLCLYNVERDLKNNITNLKMENDGKA